MTTPIERAAAKLPPVPIRPGYLKEIATVVFESIDRDELARVLNDSPCDDWRDQANTVLEWLLQ